MWEQMVSEYFRTETKYNQDPQTRQRLELGTSTPQILDYYKVVQTIESENSAHYNNK
jgi:hypothetical protein